LGARITDADDNGEKDSDKREEPEQINGRRRDGLTRYVIQEMHQFNEFKAIYA